MQKSGLGVQTFNLEISEVSDVEKALAEIDGFVIGMVRIQDHSCSKQLTLCKGSPTLGGHLPTQVQTVLGLIVGNTQARQLPCGVFGSFGWSGEAVDEMEQRLRDAGFKFAFDAIRVKMKPTAKVHPPNHSTSAFDIFTGPPSLRREWHGFGSRSREESEET